jgi:hypothetical protein
MREFVKACVLRWIANYCHINKHCTNMYGYTQTTYHTHNRILIQLRAANLWYFQWKTRNHTMLCLQIVYDVYVCREGMVLLSVGVWVRIGLPRFGHDTAQSGRLAFCSIHLSTVRP